MYQFCPWADVLYGQDQRFWQEYLPKIRESGFGGELAAPSSNSLGVKAVRFDHGHNSGIGAINLAFLWGARRVILLGYDADHTGGRRHFHADHPNGMGNAGPVDKWPAQFAAMAGRYPGRRIVNCSRATRIACFPRQALEEALRERLRIVVYTSVLGNTDPLHEPAVIGDARFVCFTDQKLKSRKWEIQHVEPSGAPTRQARTLKLTPHRLFPDADVTLWMDACFSLLTDPHELAAQYQAADMVTFKHRDRTRIVQEAHEIARIGKARPLATFRQLAAYQAEGFDTAANPMQELSCNGVVMCRNTPDVSQLNDLWLEQLERHTLRDQMSLDYCAWKVGMQLHRWPGTHANNPHFSHRYYKRPVNDY